MRKIVKENKGLTLIEILVSTVLLVIVAAMSYSVFLSIASMGSYSRDELEAKSEISGWIEKVQASRKSYQGLGSVDVGWTEISAGMMPTNYNVSLDPAEWPLHAARTSVSNLNATYNIEANVPLGSNPVYTFKRVNMSVKWDERK